MRTDPTIGAFLRKELVQTLRDKRMRIVLFAMPVIHLTVFGLAISTEVRDIRLASGARPGDAAARRLEERFFASGWFVRAPVGDPYELIRAGRADAALIPPRQGLASALERGGARLQLLVDATNTTKARAVERYAAAVVAAAIGPPPGPRPFEFDVRVLYNPAMESAIFMVPGVMSIILCLVTVVMTSMSMTKEKESGTFETILSAPVSTGEILLGKTLPYVLLGLVDAVIILTVAVVVFGVPLRGPFWMLLVAVLVFVVTTVGVGTLISTISRTQQQAMMGSFLFLFPAILMSGIMFPVENMPPLIKGVAYLDPLLYFVRLMRSIMLKGGDPGFFAANLAVLALMASGVAILSVKRFRLTLN